VWKKAGEEEAQTSTGHSTIDLPLSGDATIIGIAVKRAKARARTED
jgi:hypothetical protein